MARLINAEVTARSTRSLNLKIIRFELGAERVDPIRRSACRTRSLQCIWTDRVSARDGGERAGESEKGRRKLESGTTGMQRRMRQKVRRREEQEAEQRRPG